MIEIKGLKKYFGNSPALEDINLRIEKGEIYGFVGSDGSGKTTILRILAGVLRPSSGIISFKKDAKISYVPQKSSLYEDLTLLENIEFYSEIYQIKDKKKIEEILNFLNLKEFGNFYAGNLSGGMKQKLSLGCALVSEPEIILIDEPTNGLDPQSRRDLWENFFNLSKEGTTIVLSTSYFEEAERCTRIALLNRGKILEEGKPEELKGSFGYPVIDIFADSPKVLSESIKNLNFLLETFSIGERVHIVLKDIKFKENLIGILKEKGFEIKKIEDVLPSIEDIFIFKVKENGK